MCGLNKISKKNTQECVRLVELALKGERSNQILKNYFNKGFKRVQVEEDITMGKIFRCR